jgi:hypothetical protein
MKCGYSLLLTEKMFTKGSLKRFDAKKLLPVANTDGFLPPVILYSENKYQSPPKTVQGSIFHMALHNKKRARVNVSPFILFEIVYLTLFCSLAFQII